MAITLRAITQVLQLKSLRQQTLTLSAARVVKSFSLRPLSPTTRTANPLRPHPTRSQATPHTRSQATPLTRNQATRATRHPPSLTLTAPLLSRRRARAMVMVQALKHPPRDTTMQSQLLRMSPTDTLLKRPPSLLFTRQHAAILQRCTVRSLPTTRSPASSPPTLAHLRPESRMSTMTRRLGLVSQLAATRERTPSSQSADQST